MFGCEKHLGVAGLLLLSTTLATPVYNLIRQADPGVCNFTWTYQPQFAKYCHIVGSQASTLNPRITTVVDSFDDCILKCFESNPCDSFGFQNSTNTCTIYKKNVVTPQKGQPKGPAGFTYWQRGCFAANTLTVNPSFDQKPLSKPPGWTFAASAPQEPGAIATGGPSSMGGWQVTLETGTGQQAGAGLSQPIQLCQTTQYQVSFGWYQKPGQIQFANNSVPPYIELYLSNDNGVIGEVTTLYFYPGYAQFANESGKLQAGSSYGYATAMNLPAGTANLEMAFYAAQNTTFIVEVDDIDVMVL